MEEKKEKQENDIGAYASLFHIIDAKELRQQYIKNPPEGMTSDEVLDMSDDDLLDMDYFLHEFDELDDDDFGEEGFYIF